MPTARCRAARAAFPLPRTPEHIAVLAHGSERPFDRAGRCGSMPDRGRAQSRQRRQRHRDLQQRPAGHDQAGAERLRPDALMLMGGVVRSLQIAGALESMLDISVRYSNERVAFEKKISKFQAVQHNLAKLAGEVGGGARRRDLGRRHHRQRDVVRRRGFSGSRRGKNPLRGSRRKRRGDRPSGAWRDRLHHRAHPASLHACGRWRGATISAPRATGRSNSASWSPRAAPTSCGRWWPRADLDKFAS